MRRRLSTTVMAAALLVAFAVPVAQATGPAATMSPEVADIVSTLEAGEMATVEVALVQRADLSAVAALPRSEKAPAVVQALQATAEASQGPLRATLAKLHTQGSVADYESFWIVNGFSVTATADVIGQIAARSDVASVTLSPEVETVGTYTPGAVEPNLTVVGAPAMWGAGHTGEGVVVATLDTGVYLHDDVVDSYRGGSNSWFDPYGQHSAPFDANGHGTATMSVIVGRDAGGSAIGLAPDAQWISAKIFDDSGSATAAAIHSAFQWLLDPDGNPATDDTPDVVSNSWTNTFGGCDTTFQPDLQALRAAGILPVFAAGNAGPGPSSSRSPGNLPEAFSVGATSNSDSIYSGSSRGPSACAGDAQFPDMVAPGVMVRAADNSGLYWYPTGTSLAAPHVAGALALLLGAHPSASIGQQEAALTGGATDLGDPGADSTFGSGRLDVPASLALIGTPLPNQDPVAAFSVSSGRKGSLVFDAADSYDPDGTISSYEWDFGDGSTDSGESVSHTYSASGTYTVKLVVTDNDGATAETTLEVTAGGKKGGGGSGGGGGGGGGKGKKK